MARRGRFGCAYRLGITQTTIAYDLFDISLPDIDVDLRARRSPPAIGDAEISSRTG